MRCLDLIQGLLGGLLVDGNEFELFSSIRGIGYVVMMRLKGIRLGGHFVTEIPPHTAELIVHRVSDVMIIIYLMFVHF